MIELIELIKELEVKHGAKVRFYIGLADDGESLLIRDVVDATEECRYSAYHPSTGGGAIGQIFKDGEEHARERIKMLLMSVRSHYEEIFNQGFETSIKTESIGEWGFCDETFKTFNITLWNDCESLTKKQKT